MAAALHMTGSLIAVVMVSPGSAGNDDAGKCATASQKIVPAGVVDTCVLKASTVWQPPFTHATGSDGLYCRDHLSMQAAAGFSLRSVTRGAASILMPYYDPR